MAARKMAPFAGVGAGQLPCPLAHTAIGMARSVASWQREGVFYTFAQCFSPFA